MHRLPSSWSWWIFPITRKIAWKCIFILIYLPIRCLWLQFYLHIQYMHTSLSWSKIFMKLFHLLFELKLINFLTSFLFFIVFILQPFILTANAKQYSHGTQYIVYYAHFSENRCLVLISACYNIHHQLLPIFEFLMFASVNILACFNFISFEWRWRRMVVCFDGFQFKFVRLSRCKKRVYSKKCPTRYKKWSQWAKKCP